MTAIPAHPADFDYLRVAHRPSPALRSALLWIDGRFDSPQRIFIPPMQSIFVEPFTGLPAAPILVDAYLNGRNMRITGCRGGFTLVIGEIDCPGYEVVYDAGGVRVYSLVTEAGPG